ncbi:hypothetical protein HU200_063532 [Digitaria exilis]|uniref:non-specific serine/threonine protein kinase n=1 Tax=Digitaria exilis TaxID=1010633 RepID=A0A835ADH7_9POAL|nr:hypothetical protein HU200_063532 [Digitaria exilis]
MAAPTTKFLNLPLLLFFPILLLFHRASGAGSISPDTLNTGGNITHGETLVSANGTFTLGFFSPAGITTKKYLGIWFTAAGADAVHWVANGDTPLNGNTSGVLVLSSSGSLLLLLDGFAGQTAWSSSNTTTAAAAASPVAQLLDSGNLISFDHPSNTMLAGMKFGKNLKTGEEWSLTSWRAANDPATGAYRRVMDTKTLPDVVTWQGNVKRYRAGPWNGRLFSGEPDMDSQYKLFSVDMVDDADKVAYVLNAVPGVPFFTRFVLDEDGKVQVFLWETTTRSWNSFSWSPRDDCDDYAMCGAFGLCDEDDAATQFCGCVDGFSPASPSQGSMRDTSGGCRRDVPLDCGDGTTTDVFKVLNGVKLPDTDNATVDMSATLEQCRARCLANCSCVAYSAAGIRDGGSGCVMWNGDIVDVRYVDNGQDLYVRLAKSESGEVSAEKRKDVAKIMLPVAASLLAFTAVGICLVWVCKIRVQKKTMLGFLSASNDLGDEDLDLPFVCFGDIASATNSFSEDNLLGQGGFGKVYKGVMEDNKEVAIKRFGKGSRQGTEEFRNEVVLIAKLQHRNLVKLLGCCIHGEEKLLIYEYLPNKSLDFFIFGLLYLHQDSRLTVIHRDLKSSNILLDTDMSPKISDFGMARIFGGNQQEANTNRVVGT